VKGRGSTREGQSTENLQAVEGKVSCKRSPKYTNAGSVWRLAMVLPFSSVVAPDGKWLLRVLQDTAIERTVPTMVPALARTGSDTDRRTPDRKYSRRSQLLREISGARRRRSKKEGVQEIKSRYSWNCGRRVR
jgi:hypothetical protein